MKKRMDERSALAQRLITRREQLGLRQQDVWYTAGVSQRAYAAMELSRMPEITTLAKVADVLKISLDELLGRARWPERLEETPVFSSAGELAPLSKAG